ncbi:metacaspase-2 isoform X6 [Hydra vulgaris]|uniref:Metacaspase-2 isoform X6 n=1 Tax=Hydra vulgaris TaxID=6087 RepID=A0ABM4BLJ9_HYDVU
MKAFIFVVLLKVFFQVGAYNKEANDEPDPDTISSGETLSQNSPVFEIYEKISPNKVYKNYNSYGKIKELNKYLAAQLKEKETKPTNMIKPNYPSKLLTDNSYNSTNSSILTSNITTKVAQESSNNSISKGLPKASQASADDEDDNFNKEFLNDSGIGEGDDQGYVLIPKVKNNTNNSNGVSLEATMANPKSTSDFIAKINSGFKFNQSSSSDNIKIKNYNNTFIKKGSSKNNDSGTATNKAKTVNEESKIDRIKALLKITYKPLNEQIYSNKDDKENENNDKKNNKKMKSIMSIQPQKQWIIRVLKNNNSNTNVSNSHLSKVSTIAFGSRWALNKQHQLDVANFTSSGSGAETDYDGDYNNDEEDSEIITTSNLNPNMEKSDLVIFQENAKELGHEVDIDKNMIFPESNFLSEVYKNGHNFRKKGNKKRDKKHRHIKIYPIKSQTYANQSEGLPEEHPVNNIQELRLKKKNMKKKKEAHDPEFNLLNLEIENQSNQKRKKFQENVGNIVHNKLFNDTLFEVAGKKANQKHRKHRKPEGLVFITNAKPKDLNDYDDNDKNNVFTYDEAYLKSHDMRRRNVDALMMHRRGEIELRRSLNKKGISPSADWLRKYWGGESEENGGDISLILKKRSEIMQDEIEVPSGIGSNLGYEDKFINTTLITEQILSDMNLGESAVEQNAVKEFGLQDPSLVAKEMESVLKTDGLKAKEHIARPRHRHNLKKSQKDILVRGKRDTVLDQLKESSNLENKFRKSTAILPFNINKYTSSNGIKKSFSSHILKQNNHVISSVKRHFSKGKSKIDNKTQKLNQQLQNQSKNIKKNIRTKRSNHKLQIIPNKKIVLSKKTIKGLSNSSSVLGDKRLNIPFEETLKTDFNNIGITDLYNMDKMSHLRSAPFFGNQYDVWNPEEANTISKLFTNHPSDGEIPDIINNKVTSTPLNGITSPLFYQSPSLPSEPAKILAISSLPSLIPDYEKISSDELESYVKVLKDEKKKEAQLAQEGKVELNLEGKVDLNLELSKSIKDMLNMEVKPSLSKNKTTANLLVNNKGIEKISDKGQSTIEPIDSTVATVENQSNMLKNSKQALQQEHLLNTNLNNFKNPFIDNLYSKALSDSDEIKNLQEHTYQASTSPSQAKALNDQISEFAQTKAEKNFREMEMGRVQNELQIRNQYATSFPMFSMFDKILKKSNEEGASKKHTTINVKDKPNKKTFSKHLNHSRHQPIKTKKKNFKKLRQNSSSHNFIRHFVHYNEPLSNQVSNGISLHKGENGVEDEPLSKRVDIKNGALHNVETLSPMYIQKIAANEKKSAVILKASHELN